MNDTFKKAAWLMAAAIGASGCAPAEEHDHTHLEQVSEPVQAVDTTGYVLYPGEGEVLIPCREGSSTDGKWIVKVDPEKGSHYVAMGTQELPVGDRIPVHRHENQDEVLFIHEGNATGILGESRVPIEPGTTVFIPRGVWHSVENTEDEPVEIVWVVVPPGLEGFFRDLGVPPGEDCVAISADEMVEIRARHGVTQRIE
jgi:quercetin dioxygenase-like cupin family protein